MESQKKKQLDLRIGNKNLNLKLLKKTKRGLCNNFNVKFTTENKLFLKTVKVSCTDKT